MILIALPAVSADTKAFGFVSAQPNPAGLGETISINAWLQPPPPPVSGSLPQNRYHNFTVTITDSAGATVATFKSDASDPLGSWYWPFTPTAVGTYTATLTYPGETFPAPYNVVMASTTASYSFVVQETALPNWPDQGLPSGYWTRPISADIQGWWSITGSWM